MARPDGQPALTPSLLDRFIDPAFQNEASLRALNPRLVFASVSGFGQDGPLSPWPAYDHVVQAMSGLMSVTGTPESAPLRVGPPIVTMSPGSTPPLRSWRDSPRGAAPAHSSASTSRCATAPWR